MKTFFIIILMFVTNAIYAQSLHDVNISYQYNSSSPISFELKTIKLESHWTIFYKLELHDTTISVDDFYIEWQIRNTLNQSENISLSQEELGSIVLTSENHKRVGKISVNLSESTQFIVANVINRTTKKSWLYFKTLETNYPLIAYLTNENDEVIFEPYITVDKTVSVNGFFQKKLLTVSYYKEKFPAAMTAFSEVQAKTTKELLPDSIFRITSSQTLNLTKKGLYLIQEDVDAVEGLSFRVEDGYPKLKKFQDLLDPFIYVSTRQEFDRLKQAGTDKKKFDKVVLDITKDVERAKDFMRYYFKRAEAANLYFTSYKEGWKTDRGMIYMIYGPPKTVYKDFDREVWSYEKVNFNFIKSSTIFDPDNYVLIRNKKFTSQWYEKVDLIRNSRF